jgi:hypothetical protein
MSIYAYIKLVILEIDLSIIYVMPENHRTIHIDDLTNENV